MCIFFLKRIIVSKKSYSHLHSQMKDSMGRFRTTSLFWETRKTMEDKYPPLFTTKDCPHVVKGVTYPSLKQIYMSYDHVPEFEYEFAMDVFNSWEHWNQLTTLSTLRDLFKEWRAELEIRIKANSLRQILVAAKDLTPSGTQAAKYLAEKGYAPSKRGRPNKEEVERERKIAAGVRENLEEDMKRLGLEVVNGGK